MDVFSKPVTIDNARQMGRATRAHCRQSKWLRLYADLWSQEAIKLFLPPAKESSTQVAQPEDLVRREWRKGWDEAGREVDDG